MSELNTADSGKLISTDIQILLSVYPANEYIRAAPSFSYTMADTKRRKPVRKGIKYEIVIAVAATIVSVCALGTTLYQTYILQQQQHAAVWPRLNLFHSYVLEADKPFYRLSIRNVGIGPAIIRKVTIQYNNESFRDLAQMAQYIAKQHTSTDSTAAGYTDFSDLKPDMVIPQQEKTDLLQVNRQTYLPFLVKAVTDEQIKVTVQYESLYGQTWVITYPENKYQQLD
jgi:hypothetical protein